MKAKPQSLMSLSLPLLVATEHRVTPSTPSTPEAAQASQDKWHQEQHSRTLAMRPLTDSAPLFSGGPLRPSPSHPLAESAGFLSHTRHSTAFRCWSLAGPDTSAFLLDGNAMRAGPCSLVGLPQQYPQQDNRPTLLTHPSPSSSRPARAVVRPPEAPLPWHTAGLIVSLAPGPRVERSQVSK